MTVKSRVEILMLAGSTMATIGLVTGGDVGDFLLVLALALALWSGWLIVRNDDV